MANTDYDPHRTVHCVTRMLQRKVSLDLIARELNVSLTTVQRDRANRGRSIHCCWWLNGEEQLEVQEESGALEIGKRVRIIREPHFGSFASIVGLPPEPQMIPSEAKVRVADLELPDGTRITLPRANLERAGGS